ncbi:hypothetical protein [Wenjunlia tyrosinilytica]|uniref:Secreted protein n=1 Tax=Wenjunlia tyrosinilytica TaxID=1544741 RepID=A0A917ZCB2_9ACTN|nr:hypothetical protein [Wenjunlia tyrosinilytica]GGO80425.1 hypothetical protein GCM10012280_02310 [Wenjunlia tyrosinilytica]
MGLGDQLPTLVGVVVGGAMSYLVGTLTERSRWRREQAARWDGRLLEAYSDYADAVKECVTYYQRLAAHRGLSNHPAPLQPTEETSERAAAAEARRSAMVEPLSLLTNAETAQAVREVNQCVWHLEWLARGRKAGDAAAWEEAFGAYRTARAEFYRQARRSLNIPEMAGLPDSQWPPRWRTNDR